jgi:hypothetical protein
MGEFVGLVAVVCFFGIPLSAIWGHNRRRMVELKLRMNQGDNASVQASIEALRAEVRALRDTTMQYDISFDSALQRVESRVDKIERRVLPTETAQIAELSRMR